MKSTRTEIWDSLLLDLVVIQIEGKIVFINTAGAKMLGAATPEEIIGKPILDFVHPDYREIAVERACQMLNGGAEICAGDEKWLRLDGRSIDIEVAAMPLVYQGRLALQLMARQDSLFRSYRPERNCSATLRLRGKRQR